jgi:sugar/nucleoside kinase (ribokinase family)
VERVDAMRERTFDLLALGRPSVDLIFSGLARWPQLGLDVWADGSEVCAGTSFNTPASAHRLGLGVGYVALVGNDVWSRIVLEEFEREGLPTDFLRVVDRPSPFVSVALNHDGDRGFVSFAASSREDDDDYSTLVRDVVSTARSRHLHAYQGEFPELAAIARERGMTVSIDAWGGPSWDGEGPLEEALANADVLLANETEAIAMSGEPDVRRALARLAGVCPCVVVKRGVDGAIGSCAGETAEVPGEPVQMVDATGTGDCFNAGFLYGWLGGRSLVESLTLGTICGERAAEAFGGYRGCPTESELRGLAKARGVELR